MLSFRKLTWFILCGCLWFTVGFSLLVTGLNFLLGLAKFSEGVLSMGEAPLFGSLAKSLGGNETVAIVLIAVSLLIGQLKSVFVFKRAVKRMENRLAAFSGSIPIYKVFHWSYLFLIVFMMSLGMALKAFSVPLDIRGVIDVAVGGALLRGGMFYIRTGLSFRQKVNTPS